MAAKVTVKKLHTKEELEIGEGMKSRDEVSTGGPGVWLFWGFLVVILLIC